MLSSDERVRGRKRPTRPVINIDDRALMLNALKVVDYVFVDPSSFREGQLDPVHADILIRLRPEAYVTDGEDIRFTIVQQDVTKMVVLRRDDRKNQTRPSRASANNS